MNTKSLGNEGESRVCDYITGLGMKVLDRNFRFGKEEIDIIALDKDTYVFIEVKTRSGRLHGSPFDAVTPFKQKAIVRAAVGYIKTKNLFNKSIRFDVAGVEFDSIKYIKNAFDATGYGV